MCTRWLPRGYTTNKAIIIIIIINKNIVNKVRHIGNKFLIAVEISAQEAVYLVLQMPLRRSSHSNLSIHLIQMKEHSY